MGREQGIALSHRLNTQLFSVVGPAYVAEQFGEFRQHSGPRRKPGQAGKRWLAFCAAAGLILLAANFANIVDATARYAALAPTSQSVGFAPSMAIFGGGEPIRW